MLLKNMFSAVFSRLEKGIPFFLAKSFAAKPAVVMSTCPPIGPQLKNVFSIRYFWKQTNNTQTLLLIEKCLHFSSTKKTSSTCFHRSPSSSFWPTKKLTPGFFFSKFGFFRLSLPFFLCPFFDSNRHALVLVAGARFGAWKRGVSRRVRQRERQRVLRFVGVAAKGTCDVRWGM